jgi:hypothetical protein
LGLKLHFGKEFGVFEGFERVEVGFGLVAREEEQMERGFWKHVMYSNEICVMRDHDIRRINLWVRDVGPEPIASSKRLGLSR